MGFLDALRGLFNTDRGPALVEYPDSYKQVNVDALHVNTANLNPDTDEKLVIITLPHSALRALSLIDAPLRLTPPEDRDVTFVPVDTKADPALDPNLGWIIPLHPEAVAELHDLPDGIDAYEMRSMRIGLIEG